MNKDFIMCVIFCAIIAGITLFVLRVTFMCTCKSFVLSQKGNMRHKKGKKGKENYRELSQHRDLCVTDNDCGPLQKCYPGYGCTSQCDTENDCPDEEYCTETKACIPKNTLLASEPKPINYPLEERYLPLEEMYQPPSKGDPGAFYVSESYNFDPVLNEPINDPSDPWVNKSYQWAFTKEMEPEKPIYDVSPKRIECADFNPIVESVLNSPIQKINGVFYPESRYKVRTRNGRKKPYAALYDYM